MQFPKTKKSTLNRDGSETEYGDIDGKLWVKHTKNGITRYAEYENGSWIEFELLI